MTFLEKAMEIDRINGNDRNTDYYIDFSCPCEFNLEKEKACRGENVPRGKCGICWNREMPNTEPKVEVIPQSEVDAYNKGHADGVAQGLTDAWELADKFNNMAMSEIIKVLGIDISREEVFDAVYPQEALAKLKAYEEAQIEVGDVVLACNEVPIVVTNISNNMIFGVDTFGLTSARLLFSDCKKTGKHIDIQSILESIGE